MKNKKILKAWFDYVNSVVPDNCIVTFAEELDGKGAPRPPLPYVTLKLVSGPGHLTLDDEYRINESGKYSLVGQRSYSLSVQIYGSSCDDDFDHIDILSDISTYLDDLDKRDQLRADADIAVTSKGTAADISRLLGAGFERRGSLDIGFNSSNNKETNVGTIEHVEIIGTIESAQTITTNQIINKP